MNEHVAWLKGELTKAERDLDRKHKKLLSARREHTQAQQEVENLRGVLARVTGEPVEDAPPKTVKRKPPVKGRRRATMTDLAEDAIRERGPMRLDDLLAYLETHGRKTTRNSLNTSLNAKRPGTFERDSGDRWYLVSEGGAK